MFRPAIRTLTRAARPVSTPGMAAVRLVSAARPSPAAVASAMFSTSHSVFGQGESDVELSNRIAEEIAYEKESNSEVQGESGDGVPDFVREFEKAGVWSVEDKPGSDEVMLTRQFGNEKIQVLFSIGDLDAARELDAEEEEIEAAEGEHLDDENHGAGFGVRLAITISKGKHGALTIDAQAQDGEILIDNISFFKDSKLATELTADADWARRGLYIGPQFETLDENVQAQFESFLAERGLDSEFALFIPNFAEYKEQKEYCNWLENVKQFVDA